MTWLMPAVDSAISRVPLGFPFAVIGAATARHSTPALLCSAVPAAADDEALSATASVDSERLVLVLEDEADVRQTLCEQLHQLGYLTLEADNGEQALNMLEASPDIGMFISDLMLPGSLSGAEVINHVRSHYPQLPVLLISGQDLRPAHNPQLPDVQLLRKPFTQVQLAQALRKVMVI